MGLPILESVHANLFLFFFLLFLHFLCRWQRKKSLRIWICFSLEHNSVDLRKNKAKWKAKKTNCGNESFSNSCNNEPKQKPHKSIHWELRSTNQLNERDRIYSMEYVINLYCYYINKPKKKKDNSNRIGLQIDTKSAKSNSSFKDHDL